MSQNFGIVHDYILAMLRLGLCAGAFISVALSLSGEESEKCNDSSEETNTYVVKEMDSAPEFENTWENKPWSQVETLRVDKYNLRPDASDHRPDTRVKAVYDESGMYVLFRVRDRYIRCVYTNFQSTKMHWDSCVEFFARPKPKAGPENGGYFNFEINCGGTLKCRYTKVDEDGQRISTHKLTPEEGAQIDIYHSLPQVIDPEIKEWTVWYLGVFIPFDVLENYVGTLGDVSGQTWRANFYKCGNKTSHPHFGAWSLIKKGGNFHAVECFGKLIFDGSKTDT